jgi:NADPH:quinone reductase-like Zn-dependent oxidoreductase
VLASLNMRAMVLDRFGGPEELRLREVPEPHATGFEVRIRVHAVAINHLDVDIRQGTSRFPVEFPLVLGRESVGVVDEIGPEVQDVDIGDRVVVLPIQPCGQCDACRAGFDNLCSNAGKPGISHAGGYAEFTVAPANAVMKLPATVSFPYGAAAAVSFGTAHHILRGLAQVSPGEWLVVTGAAGGLGSACVQLGSLLGAKVIATAGSKEKADLAVTFGAVHAIDYSKHDLTEALLDATNGYGVDVAVEHIGGHTFEQVLQAMAIRGRMIVAGGHAGEIVRVDLIPFFRREIVLRGARSQTRADIVAVLNLISLGKLRPHVELLRGLDSIQDIHRRFSERRVTGKIVVIPDGIDDDGTSTAFDRGTSQSAPVELPG